MKVAYEREILELLNQIPVISKEQMVTFLVRLMDVSRKAALNTLREAAMSGIVLWSQNDYVTTREALDIVRVNEVEFDFVGDRHIRGDLAIKSDLIDTIDCFWVVLDLLPVSKDFIITTGPFKIVFTDFVKNEVVQIAKFPAGYETTTATLLQTLPSPDAEFRDKLRRIAVIDNPVCECYVPRFGFSHICAVNHADHENSITVVRKVPKEDRWQDA